MISAQGALIELVEHARRTPEVERAAARALQRDAHVLQHREMGKDRGNLERAHEAEARDVGRRERRDVVALVDDAAARRLQELGEQVEAGGLAGAVRADERVNGAALDPQRNAVARRRSRQTPWSDPRSRGSRPHALTMTSPRPAIVEAHGVCVVHDPEKLTDLSDKITRKNKTPGRAPTALAPVPSRRDPHNTT